MVFSSPKHIALLCPQGILKMSFKLAAESAQLAKLEFEPVIWRIFFLGVGGGGGEGKSNLGVLVGVRDRTGVGEIGP